MNIYISGKFTGLPYQEAYKNFVLAEMQVKNAGHTPVNPLKQIPPSLAWNDAMKYSIAIMMGCDGAFFMDNWKDSEGAKIEFEIALKLNYHVYFQRDLKHLRIISETLNL